MFYSVLLYSINYHLKWLKNGPSIQKLLYYFGVLRRPQFSSKIYESKISSFILVKIEEEVAKKQPHDSRLLSSVECNL